MADFIPWKVRPSLTEERLSIVAALLAKGRHSAVMSHSPSEGDDAWTLGTVAYRRSCYAIETGAEKYGWLKIMPEEQGPYYSKPDNDASIFIASRNFTALS